MFVVKLELPPLSLFILMLGSADCTGRAGIPRRLKLLGVLRILGRGTCLDGIKELSGISEPAMNAFFDEWCEWCRSYLYPKFVHPPRNAEELERAMLDYAILGLNGAFFSMDVVHTCWDKCPAKDTNAFTGKEGFPTIAYNVCVHHNLSACHVAEGMYGSANDKTHVRFDSFIHSIRTEPFYRDAQFSVLV
jgi:Plant transposon protein